MITSFTVRSATPEDAPDMVRLINTAEHGLALWSWGRLEGGAADPWEAGRQSVRSGSGPLSWQNCTIVALGADVAGLVVGYPLEGETRFLDDPGRDDPVFAPLKLLQARAAGCYYVHVLAVYAEYRGRGLGGLLMERAERAARGRDLALVVSDANFNARRFYQSMGFVETDSQPIVTASNWVSEGENWLLMVKTV